MTTNFYLSTERAMDAFDDFVKPAIKNAMSKRHLDRVHMHVVVLKPGVPFQEDTELPILFERWFGNPKDWPRWSGNSYKEFAHGQARLSWRTGLSSREVVLVKPHLLLPGDCIHWGSSVYGGVVTGVSNSVKPFYDEMFATMTSAAMVGEASFYADRWYHNPDCPDFV